LAKVVEVIVELALLVLRPLLPLAVPLPLAAPRLRVDPRLETGGVSLSAPVAALVPVASLIAESAVFFFLGARLVLTESSSSFVDLDFRFAGALGLGRAPSWLLSAASADSTSPISDMLFKGGSGSLRSANISPNPFGMSSPFARASASL
jgi:hypothetical protein